MNLEYLKEWEPIGSYPSGWGAGATYVKRNFPISERENFLRVLRKEKPVFMPQEVDMTALVPDVIPDHRVRAFVIGGEPFVGGSEGTENFKGGPDMFGVEWEYIPITNGSMVKPGSPKVPDINHWEDYVTFPDLDSFDWERSAQINAVMQNPNRLLRCWLMNGLNERLISLMDFANTLIAYIDDEQKEGVHRFFDKLCIFYDDLIGRYKKYYNADILMFNDDWGTARAPQFSLETAREMLVPYLKRIVDSAHKNGMYFELHSCGKNDRLVPAFVEAGVDMWLPQEFVNDFDLLYKLVDGRLVLGIPTDTTPEMSDEECQKVMEKYWKRFGGNGRVFINTSFPPQHPKAAEYMYCLSREGYSK